MVCYVEGEGKSCQADAQRLLVGASTVCRTVALLAAVVRLIRESILLTVVLQSFLT